MPEPTHQYLDQLTRHPQPPLSLADLPGFPYMEYGSNQIRYTEMERWYSGKALEETVQSSDQKDVSLYPVRINPIRTAVQKHAYILFGEVEQSDRPLVYPRILPPKPQAREAAQLAQEVLYQAWWESNGRSIQMENAITSQIYGGCIFRVAWDPFDVLRSVPVRIETIHPKNFVGIPHPNDMWLLEEAWIVKPISWADAKASGVDQGEEIEYWLIEHWTPGQMEFFINQEPANRQLSDGNWIPLSGPNPFGFVPIVYIPHIRSSGFYGDNLIDPLKGLVKEMNLRVADFGDAVSVDSHAYLGMRNVQGAPQVQQLAPGLFVINLQSAPNITGAEREPDIFELRKPAASEPMAKLVGELYDEFRREAFVPTVADGEDEGSQRSGLTLATRFWPLMAHTNTERTYWTAGLDRLNRMILRMLMLKDECGITPAHASMRIKEDWSPVLPRDREVIVNEAVARITASLGSPEHLMELLGDVEDVDEELKRILNFKTKVAELQAKSQPTPFGTSGGSGKEGPAKPTQPTKE